MEMYIHVQLLDYFLQMAGLKIPSVSPLWANSLSSVGECPCRMQANVSVGPDGMCELEKFSPLHPQ